MTRLVETNNARATKLFQELMQEITHFEKARPLKLLDIVAPIQEYVGTYESTHSLGKCHRSVKHHSFNIAVNKKLIENGTDKDIKDVLIHEIIHTSSGCFNHSNKFKSVASLIKFYLGYDGNRKEWSQDFLKSKGNRNLTYRCIKCGKLFHRYRHFDTNRYTCRCGGHLELC